MSKKWLISVMATAMVFTLGLSTGCFNVSPSKPSTSSTAPVSGTITLSAKTAQVDVYDTLQLTATKEGLDGDIVWSSSNESIATVDQNGLVSALSAGTVTITAAVGEVKATCEVTTSVSDVAPIMTVSMESLQLKKGESFDVTVSTTWKGKEVTSAQYAWYLQDENKETSDIVSISVSADGKTATFTGLGHGTETYCVSTFVNGQPWLKTITVTSVDNDVTFEVANVTRGPNGYATRIALAEGEGHVTSLAPQATVYYQGVQQDVELTWTVGDPTIAMIDSNGAIVGLKSGTTTVQTVATVSGKTGILNITVEVYAPEFTYSVETPIEVDLNGGETTELALGEIASKVKGAATSATIGETTFANVSYANGKVSVDTASIGNVYGDATITAIFNVMKGDAVASVEKVTIPVKMHRTISTKAELLKLKDYLQMVGSSAYGDFRIDEDIDMGGAELAVIGTYSGGWTHLFKGTFDGGNHTISNVTMTGGNRGLFAGIGGDAVVKNLTFVNAKFDTVNANTGLIATGFEGGTIENVVVYGEFAGNPGQDWAPASLIASKQSGGVIKNCFVILHSSSLTDYGAMIVGKPTGNGGVVENCIALNLSGTPIRAYGSEGLTIPNQEEKAGTKVYTSLNAYYKDFNDGKLAGYSINAAGKAVLEKYGKAYEESILEITAEYGEVTRGGELQLSAKGLAYAKSFGLKTAVSGVTVSADGLVKVANTVAAGTKITVVATGTFGTVVEFNVTVIKSLVEKEISAVVEYDAYRNAGATVDLSSVVTPTGTLTYTGVSVNGSAVSGGSLSGKVVTIPNDGLVDGEKANSVVISVTDDNNTYRVSVSIVKITMVIKTAEDLNWFGANSNKSQNKYYTLGNDIEYQGVYAMASGNWVMNVLDGKGYTINNFATSTSLIGAASNDQDATFLAGTVVKNIIFTNAKSTVAGKGIVVDMGTFTLKNIYVSVAADTAADTRAVWRDHFGSASVVGVVAEYLGETAPYLTTVAHKGRGVFHGLYAINVAGFESTPQAVKDWSVDAYKLFESWSDFVKDDAVNAYFDTSFWTIDETKGIPVPKNLEIGFTGGEDYVLVGGEYVVPASGYTTVAVEGPEGVTLNGRTISVAETVVGGQSITITLTNVVTGATSTKAITTKANKVVNVEEEVDFNLNNATVTTAKLTDETVTSVISIKANGETVTGATFADGVLTLPNTAFGQGKNDWGKLNVTVLGENSEGNVTINVPVLAYKSVTSLMNLQSVGFAERLDYNTTDLYYVYGYFKLTADIDASTCNNGGAWGGNGTYAVLNAEVKDENGTVTTPKKRGASYVFRGTLDGGNHVIDNYTTLYDCGGLFFSNEGTIKNLVLTNVTASKNSGIIAHWHNGTIENVYVEAKITGAGSGPDSIGLLVSGFNTNSVIKNCVVVLTEVTVDATANQGGMAGYLGGTPVTMNGCVFVNLSGKTVYTIARNAKADTTATADIAKNLSATNVEYSSWTEYDEAVNNGLTVSENAANFIASVRQ